MLVLSRLTSQKFLTFLARPSKEDLSVIRELMATRKIRPVIDKCYQLTEIAEAMRRLQEGQVRGKVVITLDTSPASDAQLPA